MVRREASKRVIAYIRVSTEKQGRSGLGLEAQQEATRRYLTETGAELIAEYREVETGKRSDRPKLAKALAHARRAKATLFVAKLDRLARNARFLLSVAESGADLAFGDLPHIPPGAAGKFIVSMLASVAELEAGLISQRTRDALAAAKARGTLLGASRPECRNLDQSARQTGAKAAGEAHKRNADEAYGDLAESLRQWRSEGLSRLAIAKRLNGEGQTTRQGKPWNHVQVGRALNRLAIA